MNKDQLKELLHGKDPNEVSLEGVVDGGSPFNQKLTYFEGKTVNEKIDDLFTTMELNPPISMTLSFEDHVYEI